MARLDNLTRSELRSLYGRMRTRAASLFDRVAGREEVAARARRQCERQKRRFERFLREQVGDFCRAVDPGPPWTRELLMRTAVMDEADVPRLLNPDTFFAGGYQQMYRHLAAAAECGFNLCTAAAVLELGCGSARLIRHLRAVEDLELVGCDVIEDSIDWCREHVPGITFHANAFDPPLEFATDGSYDLVVAQSVFTHIPLEKQDAWLGELKRVLRPGGYASITVCGRSHQELMLDDAARAELQTAGALSIDGKDDRASASTRFTGTCDVFQKRSVILRSFGRHFDVLDYQPGGQDLLVLRKQLDDTGCGYRHVG